MSYRIVVIALTLAGFHMAAPPPVDGFSATETCNGTHSPSCMALRLCHQYELCGPDEYCCSEESTTYYYRDNAS